MNRRAFLAAAGGAISAAALPAAASIILTVDTREFQAALKRLLEEMSKWNAPPTADELRTHLEGVPPILLKMNGKEVGRIYIPNDPAAYGLEVEA